MGYSFPLAENFSNFDLVWSDSVKENIIEQSKPDVVILERTERYIYTLANDPDTYLITDPLVNPSAKIILTALPDRIDWERTYNLNITVKNTGQESWDENRGVRLNILQDGKDLGFRIYIPENVIINPGDEYTFTLKDFWVPSNNPTF